MVNYFGNKLKLFSSGVITFLLVVLGLSASYSLAASELNFRTVSATNSLSQSSVLCMVQDSTGFLWIGTKDGLNRFDGYEFVTYKYDINDPNTLSNNEISCLALEGDQFLWIGTRSGGINRLQLSTGLITRFDNLTYDDLIRDLYFDQEGRLWAGTSEGLFEFVKGDDAADDRFINRSRNMIYRHVTNEAFNPIRKNLSIVSIFQHEPGKLLLGAEEGLFVFDIENGDNFKSLSTLTIDQTVFTKIWRDRRNQLWASSYDGLNRLVKQFDATEFDVVLYNSSAEPDRRLPVDWVEDFVEDAKGDLWLATRGGGLVQMSDNKVQATYGYSQETKSDIPDNIINSVYIDRTGVLWIGTESNELVYLDLYAKQFRALVPDKQDGLSDNLITAITGNHNVLVVGTAASGIDVFELDDLKLRKTKNIPRVVLDQGQWKSEISALLLDQDSLLWIGSATNSLAVHNQEGRFESYVVNGFIFSLFEDNRNNIWFGTWGQGIGYINKYTRQVEQYNETPAHMLGLGSDKVLTVFQDSRDLLWVGTKGGGLSVSPMNNVIKRQGSFQVFRHMGDGQNSLAYNDVYDVQEDQHGNIWLATGRGLNKMVLDSTVTVEDIMAGRVVFEHLSEDDGLPGGLVYTIREDHNGHLWLGTNKGLCRYIPDSGVLVSYGVNDGLPSEKFNVNGAFRESETGHMYFGGVDGMTIFHPDSIDSNPFHASVTITDLRLRNRSIQPLQRINGRRILEQNISHSKDLKLAYADNEISFEFSALHFSSPDKIRYAYRLVGFNDEWQETGSSNRRITYTNLRFGEYTLQVRATNNDGIWAPEISELNIVIAPPIWLTIWAYLLYVVFFLFLLIVFRKYSLIAVKKKNQLIIESLEHKKETEIAEAKMRFFTNVSHEIRTPLTLIHAPLQQLIEKNDTDEETHHVLVMVFRNVKRLLTQVNQLLELRKMDKGQFSIRNSVFDLEAMLQESLLDFEPVLRQNRIEVKLESVDNTSIYSDKRLMDTIIHNLLSNSIKFSPVNGELRISVERLQDGHENGLVRLKITDAGPGIPEDEIANVFNRFYQLKNEGYEHLGGSGIGLSIVKEFVEQLKGDVQVYNIPTGGCQFEVTIPVGKLSGEQYPEVKEEVREALAEITPVSGLSRDRDRSQTLVIVEDDADLSAYLKTVFDANYKTVVFNNGRKACEEIPALMPDLIICDVMLPGMNGIELTKNLKSRKETSHIPIIMLTARTGDENVVDGLHVGADSYITKPFNINVLEAQVESVAKSREAFRARFSKQMVLEPTEESITPMDERFLSKLMEITDRKLADPSFDVSFIIEEMHMSHSIILKKVKALTGLSLVEFIRSMRIKKAAQIFRQDKLSVSEVGFMVGFSDPKYFSKCFTKEMGMKPTEFVKQQHG
jgi:signal transduction histidine kinase/ligand-binding sensor domain-containing protein/DNA-binding NarL/FixJ family response regulator